MERKNLGKCILALTICLICILTVTLPARAADIIDTSKKASLTVTFRPDDISASDVEFKLYRIASVDEYTELTLTSKFEGLSADLSSPDESVWESLAATAESYISENSVNADYTASTDENGVVSFENLPLGLYLLRGETYITDSHDAYAPQSYLIMLPSRDSDGKWVYDVESVPKFTKSDELIDITVKKKWKGGKAEDRPDYITVVLYCDDAEYETVSFSDAENWVYKWDGLSAKYNWTISEVSVEGFTSSIEPNGRSFIITNTSKDRIPQTGILWWPVPVLAVLGVGLAFAGTAIIRKNRKTNEE